MAEGGESLSRGVMSMQMQRSFTSVEQEELTHIKNLGRGGFGIVTLERHKRWGKVAVKQVIEKKVTREAKEAFYREARQMLDVITSPHLVSVMGMVEAPDGGISIIMEYMEYGNLKHFTPLYLVTKEMAPNPGDNAVFRSDCWPRRMLMICEMIKGMNFLHTLPEPIFHRDLKLENVFVGPGFRVKIGDLGLAVSRVSRSAQCNTGSPGTYTHLPPEILTRKVNKATEAWDRYCFGITLFEFVTLTPDNARDIPWPAFANDGLIYIWVTTNERPDTALVLEDTPRIVVDTMKECWNGDFTKRPSFQDLQQRFVTLYEEKYESSIRSANIQINVNISRHEQDVKEEEAKRTPTGLTPNSSPSTSPGSIQDIHGGSSERKTKQPIQNVSTSDGRRPGSSAGSSSTSQGSTRPPIMVQSHARPPAAFGSQSSSSENAVAPSEGPADTQVVQPTSSSTQPSQTAAAASTPEGPVPAISSFSPDGETVSPDRSISPLKSMPQHDASGLGGMSAQEGQRMQQQPDWKAARRLGERKSGSPDLPGPRSPDDPPIPPLTSTVPPYEGDQRWQQQQSNCRTTFDEGTTRFSSSTNMPQQATPSYGSQDDYDIPLKVHLPKDGKHMTSDVDLTLEDIRRPFQDMNLQATSHQPRHLGLPEQCSIVRCFKAVLVACPRCHNHLCREHIEGFCPCGSKTTSNNSSYSGNTEATDKRLMLLIDKLDPDDLKKLYNHLNMSDREVHKAELAARSENPDLMALSVLRRWRQKKGRSATCEVLLEALLLCECVDAKEELVDEWNLRDYSDQGGESGGMPSNPRRGGPYGDTSPRREGPYGDTSPRREGPYGDTSPRREGSYGDTSPRREGLYGDTSPRREGLYGDTSPRREGLYGDTSPRREGLYGDTSPRREGLYGDTSPRREGLYGDTSPRREGLYGDTSPVKICRPESVGAMPVQEKYQGAGRMLVSSSSTSNLYQEMNPGPRRSSPQRALTVPQVRCRSLSPRRQTPLPADVGRDRAITEQDIGRIDQFIGRKYRDLGRQLGLTNVELDVIEMNNMNFGVNEYAHQVLLKWINRHGRRATKSDLIRALRNVELANLCYQI